LNAAAESRERETRSNVRTIAIIVLGILVPVFVLVQAYLGLSKLSDVVSGDVKAARPAQVLADVQPHLRTGNDYALFSVIAAEHTNEVVVTNKQVMKTVTMQLGFAVVSLGLMLTILGINDGGANGSGDFQGLKFDFKTGSTGVVVFVVGAAMAAAGGLLKNEYNTVPIPEFVYGQAAPSNAADARAAFQYRQCKAQAGKDYRECFVNSFEKNILGDGS